MVRSCTGSQQGFWLLLFDKKCVSVTNLNTVLVILEVEQTRTTKHCPPARSASRWPYFRDYVESGDVYEVELEVDVHKPRGECVPD